MTSSLLLLLMLALVVAMLPRWCDCFSLEVLFQNDHLAVVNKPASVACHRYEQPKRGRSKNRSRGGNRKSTEAETEMEELTVLSMAREVFSSQHSIHLVHRLDKPTSGCLLFAFSPEAARALGSAMGTQAEKTYCAICRGNGESLRMRNGDMEDDGGFVVDDDVRDAKGVYREATTHFRALEGSDNAKAKARRCCLVKASLTTTGRYHQIRQHLGKLSHPIVGEAQHRPDRTENREWKKLLLEEQDVDFPLRLCLHCHRLVIPTTIKASSENTVDGNNDNETTYDDFAQFLPPGGLDVSCPMPKDMSSIIDMTDWAAEARTLHPELFSTITSKE